MSINGKYITIEQRKIRNSIEILDCRMANYRRMYLEMDMRKSILINELGLLGILYRRKMKRKSLNRQEIKG
jgi:hypothetical protein